MTIATVGSFNVIFLWLTLQQGLDPALEPDQSSDRYQDPRHRIRIHHH